MVVGFPSYHPMTVDNSHGCHSLKIILSYTLKKRTFSIKDGTDLILALPLDNQTQRRPMRNGYKYFSVLVDIGIL